MLGFLQIGIVWLARRVWYSLPLIVTAAITLLALVPFRPLGAMIPAPDIVLAAVFYWAIFGPQFLPPWSVFALGLAQDFATGAPVGFWALIYLIAYGFTLSQRVFFIGRTGMGVWFGFVLVAFLTATVAWVLSSILFGRFVPVGPILFQTIVSVVVYPVASRVFTMMRRMLTTARETL
jgi:rod shape-determining protein MreD